MVRGQWQLLRRFLEESLLRLVFTEGENFALTAIGDVAARGTFQVISQLGSMVVRLVLSVWEGACFSRWSRLLAGGEHEAAVLLLRRMLKVMLFFGFSFILLGPPLSGWLLGVLYSSRWSSPETVRTLQLYCYATPAMGFSGLLECFLRAAASPEILRRQQKVLLVLSTAYVCGCFAIVTYRQEDAVSCLVLLNICSKVLRGWTSAYLITQCTKPGEGHSPLATWRDLTNVVGWRTVSVMLCLLRLSRVVPPRVSHMTGVGLLYLLLILTTEEVRQLIQEGVAKLRSRRVVQKSKE
ncbi:hypothetical protein AGDE_12928 [Angomonas deanei]|uniref:Protein RFT1 homolog n=1 Tax=Angomonas deanei TaxID=59799 RepID=A0A7G2CH06_9TRYP|nr:hypothetical protein AGDE_12928 [Angomonas deanei]CAD2218769.1 Rft protein, putative [Angomonas deanei]|eukprot:EPY23240.1 hypothetical protein AGDE_12928 [Angomonas deanei]